MARRTPRRPRGQVSQRSAHQQRTRRSWQARNAGWLALVLAVAGAAGVWTISDQAARNDESSYYGKTRSIPEPGELLRKVIAQKDQRVVVAEEVTLPVDPADLAEARRILAAAGTEVYLFMIPDAADGDLYTQHGAAEVLGAQVLGGKPGWVVSYFPDGGTVISEQGGAPSQYLGSSDGQPGPNLVRMATEMATWTLEETDD